MKKLFLKAAVLTALLSILLSACGDIGGQTKPANGGGTGTDTDTDNPISGTLTGDTETWAGKDADGNPITYYIKKNSTYTIKDGGKLIIQEGAIVKLGANSELQVSIGGTLEATGAVFTSAKDSRGRKITAAGQDAPAPADWKRIYVHGGHVELYNSEISYGGSGYSTVDVAKNGSTFGTCKIDGCKFTNNSGTNSVSTTVKAAVYYSSSLVYGEDNAVTNTTFENNVWPMSLPVSFSVSGTNHFGTGDKANKFNLIHMYEYRVTGEVVWEHTEVPYLYASSSEMNIGYNNTDGKLTIKGPVVPEDPNETPTPTVVQFYQKGLVVRETLGTLNVDKYVHFTNCQNTPDTKYPGLFCYKKDISYIDDNGKTRTYSDKVLLESNDTLNITIDGYNQTGYTESYKHAPIKDKNTSGNGL